MTLPGQSHSELQDSNFGEEKLLKAFFVKTENRKALSNELQSSPLSFVIVTVCLNLLSLTPLRRTLRACDHMTHARCFQIIISYYY